MAHKHFKLFKPYGYLSQFQTNAKHERNKKLLGTLYDFPKGTMAIGRLDKNSEGLLLLTTDGKVSHHFTSSKVEKEYFAQVDGEISTEAIKRIKQGVSIVVKGEAYTTKPCAARLLKMPPNFPERAKKIRDERHGKTSWISITLSEGKFHQVRKMTAQVGFPTLRLVRVRIGNITLEGLDMGAVMPLSELGQFC